MSEKRNKGCPVCGSPTCNCGDSCRCTEEEHCSRASSLLQSLAKPVAQSSSPTLPSPSVGGKGHSPKNGVGKAPSIHSEPKVSSPDPLSHHDHDHSKQKHKRGDFTVLGMKCSSCSNTIERALVALPGVTNVKVSLEDKAVVVEWDEPPASILQVSDVMDSVGFHVATANERVDDDENNNNHDCCVLTNDSSSDLLQNNTRDSERAAVTVVQKVIMAVSGMTCSMCSQAIEGAVRNLEGVESIHVSLPTDSAVIQFRSSDVTVEAIQEAIEDVGYNVDNVILDSPAGNALSNGTSGGNRNNSVGAGGSEETVEERWQRLADRQERKVKQRQRSFLWSLAGTLPIIVLTMILPRFVQHGFLDKEITMCGRTFLLEGLILLLIATPVQFLSGWDFYRMSFYNLRAGRAGMDVLVALGTSASYGYACWGLWKNDHESAHFFETSATLICFVLAGKWMQALAVRRTSKALTELMKLQSSTAVKVTPGKGTVDPRTFNPLKDHYREETVPIAQVKEGDLVKVIRGSSIPADGRIKYGEMSVDESMVTGESMPVLKTPGSDVLGGTVCVETSEEGSGAIFIEVTGVGSDTALAQIIELVQDAQTRSVPIQSFADSVSSVFVPTVCVFSLLTYMVWYALCSSGVVPAKWYEDVDEGPGTFSLTFGIACLVISCPCALGLATPTAVMVGAGTGARLGILMKGGEALEVASKVDSIVLDKTGTLTKGQPSIVDFHMVGDDFVDTESLLWMLGSLEKNSEHPLAEAVVAYVQQKLGDVFLENKPFVQPKSFKALTGRGAMGVLDEYTIAVGNRPFAFESGIEITDEAEFYMQALEREGKTAVLVSVNGTVCLVMGIADKLKADAAASVVVLRDVMKLDVWMVTGDNHTTARAIGNQLGLPENRIISEALPAAKVQQVRKLQAEDRIVAMVGDGINDSPALAQADVGISLGSGAKIATEASDMVLVRGNVADVCTALHLSHSIFRRIQLNLLFSLIYNCLGIPIAAGAFYPFVQARLPPTLAGAAMALSSVSVVLSSLSLRFYRPPRVTMRRQSSFAAWARDMEQRSEMEENLLINDHLGCGDFTETTAIVDNRSSTYNEDNIV